MYNNIVNVHNRPMLITGLVYTHVLNIHNALKCCLAVLVLFVHLTVV